MNQNRKEKNFEEKIKNILNFIEKSNNNDIEKGLINKIKYNEYCPIILGEGLFGRAYIPAEKNKINYNIGGKKVKLPIVVKETLYSEKSDSYFTMDILESKLYISGYKNLTTEALILMYIRELWKETVHLPLLLGYGTCLNNNVSKIITYRYGLKEPVKINLSGKIFNPYPNNSSEIFISSISTLRELLNYIHYKQESNGLVELPNGIKCNHISELYDYICISYLATHELLANNKIYASDMHPENIFIHWLNDESYYKDKKIKNIKEIVYKVDKKYYKIKTFGFVIILGDTGLFIKEIKKDKIIIGNIWNIRENIKFIEKQMCSSYTAMHFIIYSHLLLNFQDFIKTIAFKILKSKPYSLFPLNDWGLLGLDLSYLDKLKTSKELLEYYYEKYGEKKYEKHEDNILIII